MNVVQFRQRVKADPMAKAAALAATMGLQVEIGHGDDFQYLSIGEAGEAEWSLMLDDDGSWLLCWAGSANPLAGGSQSFLQNYATAREALMACCKMVREAC